MNGKALDMMKSGIKMFTPDMVHMVLLFQFHVVVAVLQAIQYCIRLRVKYCTLVRYSATRFFCGS